MSFLLNLGFECHIFAHTHILANRLPVAPSQSVRNLLTSYAFMCWQTPHALQAHCWHRGDSQGLNCSAQLCFIRYILYIYSWKGSHKLCKKFHLKALYSAGMSILYNLLYHESSEHCTLSGPTVSSVCTLQRSWWAPIMTSSITGHYYKCNKWQTLRSLL